VVERLRPSVRGSLAFLVYLLVSVALWGRGVLAHLSTRYAGVGKEDAKLYIWALAWWPYAIRHGLNPVGVGNAVSIMRRPRGTRE
jgi:hypothetical protein